MNKCSCGRLFVSLFIMMGCGLSLEAMEPKSDRKIKSKHSFVYTRPDGTSRCVFSGPDTSTVQRAPQPKAGISFIHEAMRGGLTASAIEQRMCQIPLHDQQDIIKTAESADLKWLAAVACKAYAQTIARDEVMQSLFASSDAAQAALEMGLSSGTSIAQQLNETFKEQIDRLALVSGRQEHRLYNVSVYPGQRQDAFIMQPSFSDDVVSIQRDYRGNRGHCDASFIAPLVVHNSSSQMNQLLDQDNILCCLQRANKPHNTSAMAGYFDGRIFKLSRDGSWMLGLCATGKHDLDTLVLFGRTADNKFKSVKAVNLDHGILTQLHILDKHEVVKGIALCGVFYDVQTSFAIRPNVHEVAYIDTRHNVCIIDLATGQISQVTTEGNVLALAWSPDGNSLAFSTSTGKLIVRIGHGVTFEKDWGSHYQIHKLQWSSDGSQILLMTDSCVELIRRSDGNTIGRYGESQAIVQATLSDDATKILIASADKTISLWDVPSRACIWSNKLVNAHVIAVQLSPDSRYASMTAEQNGTVGLFVWDIQHNSCVKYNKINEINLSELTARLKSGWPSYKTLSLPQMMLFLAAAKARDKASMFTCKKSLFGNSI